MTGRDVATGQTTGREEQEGRRNPETTGIFSIFASLPGAFILSSVLLFIHVYVRNKFAIVKTAEAAQ